METNTLLAALTPNDRDDALNGAVLREFGAGQVAFQGRSPIDSVFFPVNCVLSLVKTMTNGSRVELGLIGNEGMIGIDAAFGSKTHTDEAMLQSDGSAYQVSAVNFQTLLSERPSMRGPVLLFTSAFMLQMAQRVACNRLHDMTSRLACWLLMVADRIQDPYIEVTQRSLAQMLGTRAAGVSESIQRLEAAGVIVHRRKQIEIVDRKGLERASCECYQVVTEAYERILGSPLKSNR